jgi:glycosyltransferase involved in cell wall biosynthesis
MRIVLLVHRFHPDIGGVETTAEVLARGWTERHGDQVTVITHTTESDPGVSFPFAVLREPTRGELWRAMRGADVIFHNNPCMQFYWPQVLLRKPWVVALRMLITGPDPVPPGPRRLVMAMKYALVERADVVVANSSYTRGHVEGADQVIPNSYRDSVLRVTDPADRQPLDLVFVGRLDPIKGIDLLIGSVADLTAEGRPVSLTIIGEGRGTRRPRASGRRPGGRGPRPPGRAPPGRRSRRRAQPPRDGRRAVAPGGDLRHGGARGGGLRVRHRRRGSRRAARGGPARPDRGSPPGTSRS